MLACSMRRNSVHWSVFPSACPSDTRVLCDKTKQYTADILILRESAITLVLWHQQWLVGNAPFVRNLRSKWPTPFEKRQLRQMSAYNVSIVRDSEKVQLWRTGSRLYTDFTASYRWSAFVTSKSPKFGPKSDFLFFVLNNCSISVVLQSFFV